MLVWKNMLLNRKLALGYGVLILVFLISGSFTVYSLFAYKKELSTVTEAYIPLVANTNKIERLTNQTLYHFREYTASGNVQNYKLCKARLVELSNALSETRTIINVSPELKVLKGKLERITKLVEVLTLVIDETAEVQESLETSQHKFKIISSKYSKVTKKLMNTADNDLRKLLYQKDFDMKEVKDRQRKNQLIHRVVDKANMNMIAAFEAISFENPEYLKPTLKEFKIIFHLLSVLDKITTGYPENGDIKYVTAQLLLFQKEVLRLNVNQVKYRELTLKQGDLANIVITEATSMGKEGILLAGDSLQSKYKSFDRLITIFYMGLIIAFLIAIVFSVLITRSITIPLAKSVKFAEEVASGNLDASVQIDQKDEVGMLATSLKNMGVKLKENIANLRQVKREMLSLSLETEEKERKRFAEDLHDGLGPLLSTIKLFLSALKDHSLPQERKEYLINSTDEILLEAIATTKNISYNLLPSQVSDFGLDIAINSFCNRISEVSGVSIEYSSDNYPSNLNRHLEIMLFRIIKELVNNTIKHANASNVNIGLYFKDEVLHIDYSDNGKGYDLNSPHDKKRQGLGNILNRAKYLKGSVNFVTSPGNGFKVFLKVDKKNLVP